MNTEELKFKDEETDIVKICNILDECLEKQIKVKIEADTVSGVFTVLSASDQREIDDPFWKIESPEGETKIVKISDIDSVAKAA